MKSLSLIFAILMSFSGLSQSFPSDWMGKYSGDMLIGNINRDTDTISVLFEMNNLIEDSVWTYKMTFNSEQWGTVVKDYKIAVTKIGDNKRFVLDENNGIVMELTFMDGTFYGMYEVMGVMYISTMKYDEGELYFDLFGAPTNTPTVTSAGEGDEKVEATSYRVTLHQTVKLTRENE